MKFTRLGMELNHSASLAMSTSVLEALPGKLDIKRRSPNIIYLSIGLQSAKDNDVNDVLSLQDLIKEQDSSQ